MKAVFRSQLVFLVIAGFALLVSLAALYWFASEMKAKEARVIEARDHLASFEQNKRIFTEEAKELEAIRARVETLEGNILTKASIPPLLSSLEAMAASRGVAFTLTAVDEIAATDAAAPRLHIDFSAEGSFANLQLLAKDMLSQTYQARFSNFSLFLSGKNWQLLGGIDITSF